MPTVVAINDVHSIHLLSTETCVQIYGAVNKEKSEAWRCSMSDMSNKRGRIPFLDIDNALYLYFLGLSTRGVAKAIFHLHKVRRSHVAIWKWIQKYEQQKISSKNKSISEFIVDETLVKVGPENIWLWATIEPENTEILALSISKERNMFVAERFLDGLIKIHGKHCVSTDEGGIRYPQAC